MLRWVSVLALLGLVVVVGPPSARAATSVVTLDDSQPALAEAGNGWTAVLGFTNLTDRMVALTAKPTGTARPGCDLMLGENPSQSTASLPAAQHTDVKVSVPAACKAGDKGFAFEVTATAGSTPAAFHIDTKAKASAKPDWTNLWAFLVALVVLGALAVGLFAYWDRDDFNFDHLANPMPYLGTTWSFKDSLVSNVTVAGGLLTGIFGSSGVVKALLGKDAEAFTALAIVGVAIAIAFVGAGGIVLLAFKTRKGNAVTVGGLLAASVITLTGAFGELWVVSASGHKVTGGLGDVALSIVMVAAMALLLVYALRSVLITLDLGTIPPLPPDYRKPPLTETIFAASMIVEALKARSDVDAIKVDTAVNSLAGTFRAAALEHFRETPGQSGATLEDLPTHRERRAALL